MDLTRNVVNNSRENKVSRVSRALVQNGLDESAAHSILLQNGAFKAYAVRRDLIHGYAAWRERVVQIQSALRLANQEAKTRWKPWAELDKEGRKTAIRRRRDVLRLRGELRALEAVRKQIREMLFSEKWRAADNDQDAQRFLTRLQPKEEPLVPIP